MNLNFKNTKKILFFLLLAALFFILIYNLLHYDPILGYDAEAHYAYIDTFSRYLPRRIRIPTSNETREFFNPPIAYVFPAIIQVFCRKTKFWILTNPIIIYQHIFINGKFNI